MSDSAPPLPSIEMPIPLPQVLQEKLAANGGIPLVLEDPETRDRFFLQADPSDLPILKETEYLREEIAKSVRQIEQGKKKPFDIERTIEEAERRRQESSDG